MNTKNNALYDDCPYLHYVPECGRSFLASRNDDGFRVLARLVSITGSLKSAEGEQILKGAAQGTSATFEVIGADWAMGWLKLSFRDWISDVKRASPLTVSSPWEKHRSGASRTSPATCPGI